jgi:hypothetical protein
VSTAAVVLLGLIAGATVVMAALQVGLVVAAGRLARRMEQLSQRLEQDVRPLIASMIEWSDNAVRASSLVVAQVERADRLVADLTARVEDTARVIQGTILAPAREGRALAAAIAAAVRALREAPRGRSETGETEDDDPLFIG